jgi:hypothetical protein
MLEIKLDVDFPNGLSRSNGHLFLINPLTTINEFINLLPTDHTLTTRQIKLLQCLTANEHGSSKIKSLSVIEEILDIKRVNLNKIISELVDLNIIVSIPFSLPEGISIGKCKCFQLADKNTWFDIYATIKPSTTKSRSKRITNSQLVERILGPNELPSNIIENDVSKGMYPSGVPQFEKFLPNRYYKKRTFVKEALIGGKKVLIELRTSDSALMYDEDLKNVFILMTLFINQQANSLNYYIEKKIPPSNLQYVEIRHIMKALKKGSAGSYYDSFVKSIMRIKRTTFDLHELEAIFTDTETDEKFFATKDFSFFKSCWPISSEGGVVEKDIDDNEFVKINPKGFLIKWNDVLFNKMLSDNYFFVLPLSILSAYTPIFLLYMYLRNFFSRRSNQKVTLNFTIEEMHQKLTSSATVHNFKRDLLTAINAWLKQQGEQKIIDDVVRKFDIEGFAVIVHLEDGNLTSLQFRVNMRVMLSSLDIETNDNGLALSGNKAAPTVLNPMYEYLPMLSRFKETRGGEFPGDFNVRLLLPKALKNVSFIKTGRGTIDISYHIHDWTITHYTSNKTIISITEDIYPDCDDGIQQGVFSNIVNKRDKLHSLSSGDHGLTREVFEALLMALVKDNSLYFEEIELYKFLYKKDLLIKLLCLDWEELGIFSDKILKIFLETYNDNNAVQQSLI